MDNYSKIVVVDFEGVVTPVDPKHRDPDSPVWQRVRRTRELAEQYRIEHDLKPLNKYPKGNDTIWQDHTELTSVLNMIMKIPYNIWDTVNWEDASEITRLIPTARSIINKATDYYFELVEQRSDLRYETNPGIVNLLKEMRIDLGIPLYPLSGNPKRILEDKFFRTGILDLFLIDGKLPDLPIYGEDILQRYKGLDKIQEVTGFPEDVICLADRESDLNIGLSDISDRVRHLHFGQNPLDSAWFQHMGDAKTPITKGYLSKLVKENRIMFVPHGIGDKGIYQQALEFVKYTPTSHLEHL